MTQTPRENQTIGERASQITAFLDSLGDAAPVELPIEVHAFRQREAARTYGVAGWSYTQLIASPAALAAPSIQSLFARTES